MERLEANEVVVAEFEFKIIEANLLVDKVSSRLSNWNKLEPLSSYVLYELFFLQTLCNFSVLC